MSATITETEPYDAMLAREAHQVFTRAKSRALEWPEQHARVIGNAVWDLGISLKHYWDLRNGIVPAWLPGIIACPEGFALCYRMAAEQAREDADEVIKVIRERCGDKAAAFVSGTEGGEAR